MQVRIEGATPRQDSRSDGAAARSRRPRNSIAPGEYERACLIAGAIIGVAFGLMFAIGIMAA